MRSWSGSTRSRNGSSSTSTCRSASAAPDNSRALTEVDPAKQQRVSLATQPLMQTMMERSATDELRWVGTVFPTQMVAADAEMSLTSYEDMYFAACLCDLDDPVAAWQRAAAGDHAPARLDRGARAGPDRGSRAPTSRSRSRGATGSPATARRTCRAASSSPVRSRTARTATSPSICPRSTAGAASAASASSCATARSSTRAPSRARTTSCRCSTPTAAHASSASSASARTSASRTRHALDPARREDRRHRPPRDRPVVSRDRRHEPEQPALGHDLRPATRWHDHRGRRDLPARRPVRGVSTRVNHRSAASSAPAVPRRRSSPGGYPR